MSAPRDANLAPLPAPAYVVLQEFSHAERFIYGPLSEDDAGVLADLLTTASSDQRVTIHPLVPFDLEAAAEASLIELATERRDLK